ncbi:MAG: transcription elongation factor GreA [Omnitrophica bacterium RBG_13_46_9]|nr:MAG: transcription elongation factor GreA [Omnitrophica bacterium RBG_13_46_9]
MANTYLTPEGYEKLREELKYLKTVRRRELSSDIGKARAHGDLSENAEYDAAKEAQGMNEKRIAELEEKLANAQILDDENIPKNEALIGATVKLKDLDSGEELEYTLVSELEADYSQGKISVTSPVGKGLLGHKVKETVEIQAPAGILKYQILKISR